MSFRKFLIRTQLSLGETLDLILSSISANSAPKQPARHLELMELEERVLLSAAPVAVLASEPVVFAPEAVDMAVLDPSAGSVELTEAAQVTAEDTESEDWALSDSVSNDSLADVAGADPPADDIADVRRELVFVDTSAEDYQQLLDDLWSNDDPDRQFDVVLLTSDRDGTDDGNVSTVTINVIQNVTAPSTSTPPPDSDPPPDDETTDDDDDDTTSLLEIIDVVDPGGTPDTPTPAPTPTDDGPPATPVEVIGPDAIAAITDPNEFGIWNGHAAGILPPVITQEFASFERQTTTVSPQPYVLATDLLWGHLDLLKSDLARDLGTNTALNTFVVGTASAVTTGLSVGYVVWALRGGSLLASVLSSMPAWRFVDPLVILDNFDRKKQESDDRDGSYEETLESIALS